MLRFRLEGRFLEHRLANDRLDPIRPNEDIARRSGPIMEAEFDRATRPLGVAL